MPMLEFVPPEIREMLRRPRRRDRLRGRSLRLHLGDAIFPIRRLWDDGLAIDAARLTRLRGRVEIREGNRRVWTCLIVAAEIEGDELVCSFKRLSPAQDSAPADYWRGAPEPGAP